MKRTTLDIVEHRLVCRAPGGARAGDRQKDRSQRERLFHDVSLELQAQTQLLTPAEVDDTSRLPKARISFRRDEIVETAVIVEIAGIEHFGDDTERRRSKNAHIFRNAELDG